MKLPFLFFLTVSLSTLPSFGQVQKPDQDTLNISFRDTVFNIALDSLKNDLGIIDPSRTRMVKYIKYVGNEEVRITRSWTSDPHFICGYPQGPLIPGKVYALQICFYHQQRAGSMHKYMGFDLSDGNQVMMQFKGTYPPLPPEAPAMEDDTPPPANTEPQTRNPEPLLPKNGDTLMSEKPIIPSEPFDSNLVQERMASFPGGNDSLNDFIKRNFNRELIRKIGQNGKIVLAFTVNTDGSLSNFSVKKSLHPELDKELIRVMKKSPKWIPQVCSKVDPGFYLDPNEAYYYCEASFVVPFRIEVE